MHRYSTKEAVSETKYVNLREMSMEVREAHTAAHIA